MTEYEKLAAQIAAKQWADENRGIRMALRAVADAARKRGYVDFAERVLRLQPARVREHQKEAKDGRSNQQG